MKYLTALAAFGIAISSPTSALAQDAEASVSVSDAQLALAREVVDNGFPPETRIESMLGVADQLIAQMRAGDPRFDSDPRLTAVLDRFSARVMETTRTVLERHIDSMMDGMALAYADTFSQAELEALHAFVTSPEGYGFLTRITDINSHPAFAEANQAYVTEYMSHMPDLQMELQADLLETMSKDSAAK